MTAFKDSSFLSAVLFSFSLCQPAQCARHLRKLSLPTFVRAGCPVTEAQYSEVLWGGYQIEDHVVELSQGISFHDLNIVYCFVT
jgi:hypothetical protein